MTFVTDAPPILHWLATATYQSAILAAVVILILACFGRWVAPKWRYAMWAIVLVRLAMPVQLPAPWHVSSVVDLASPRATPAVLEPDPTPTLHVELGPIPLTRLATESPAIGARSQTPPIATLIVRIWVAVAAAGVVWTIVRHARTASRLRSRTARVADERIDRIVARLTHRRPVHIRTGESITSPAVFGVVRPVILLPMSMLERASEAQLRYVLLHEISHLRRFDPQIDLLARFVCCVHWFNPVAWFALARLRGQRELACDSAVLDQIDANERPAYGHLLLELATTARSPLIAMASSSQQLKGRILQIARFSDRRRRAWLPSLLLASLAAMALTTTLAAEPPPDAPTAETAPATIQVVPIVVPPATAESKVDPKRVETRAYDIRDLIISVPDFTAPEETLAQKLRHDPELQLLRSRRADYRLALSSMMKDRGEQHPIISQLKLTLEATEEAIAKREKELESSVANGPAEPTREQIVKQVMSLITDTTATESWRDNGGTVGTIREHNGQLIVSQTVAAHEQLSQLLTLLREGRAFQIMLETRIVALDIDSVPEGALKSRIAQIAAGDVASTRPAEAWFLNEKELAGLLQQIRKIDNAAILSAPRVTLFNGQRAYVSSERQHSYVSKFQRAENGKDWEPVIDVVGVGTRIDLQATLSADRRAVTVTVRGKQSQLIKFEPVEGVVPPGVPEKLQVTRPVTREQSMATTVSIPDHGTVVLGGLGEDADEAGKPAKKPRVVLMLLNATVIHQQDAAAPATQPATP